MLKIIEYCNFCNLHLNQNPLIEKLLTKNTVLNHQREFKKEADTGDGWVTGIESHT